MEIPSDITYGIIAFIAVYCAGIFLDIIFKTCMFYPYLKMLDNIGLTIKPHCLVWQITRFNQALRRMGHYKPTLLKRWFAVGFYLSFLSLIVSLGVLIVPILSYFIQLMPSQNVNTDVSPDSIIPVVPGLTTPLSHIRYVIPTLVISVLFHEFGHALAASRENVPVKDCGLSLYFLLPVAFVNLDSKKLNSCSSKQQLRIYCAGVWHNFVMLVLSLLFLNYASNILYPHYQTNIGVTVIHIEQTSNLAHLGGFIKGDVVTSINNCDVKDATSWYKCLAEISSSPQLGFCSTKHFLDNYGNITNCCTNYTNHFCFHNPMKKVDPFLCLHARKVIDEAPFCRENSDCKENLCLIPFLPSKNLRLISFQRNFNKSVLFIGSLNEVFSSVKISSWTSELKFPSVELLSHLELFLQYLAIISGSLVIMNVIPCYYTDGGFIIEHLIHYICAAFNLKHRYIAQITLAQRLKAIGFFLLTINILLSLKNIISL